MSRVEEIILQLQEVAATPLQSVKKFIKNTGNKAIGCMYYTPEELVHASGMLPVGIWGANMEISSAKKYFPAFYCSILQTSLELGMNGAFDDLSGVIIPAHCDSLRAMGQNWKVAVPQVEYISLVHPVNRKTEAGKKFLISEYETIKNKLERISGNKITNETINNSIDVYNNYRKIMREFTKVASEYPDIITPSVRHAIIKSGYFMEKSEFTRLVKELISELNATERKGWGGLKMVVSGIIMDSPELLQLLEENEIAVVADDLAQETRQFRSDVPEEGAPLERLANYWSIMEGCSLLFDPEKKRGDMLVKAVKDTNADGVIVCMTKFCDPEEFDYPIIKKQLETAGIPHVYIETDQQTKNDEQAKTRIQAFREMLLLSV
jgi:bcr-type benzoyl-CoA reductase subunit C